MSTLTVKSIWNQLEKINRVLNRIYIRKTVNAARTINQVGRLFIRGQIVFEMINGPFQVELNIDVPLGPDDEYGGHNDQNLNSKNFLRRSQLPHLRVDMTNVYHPSVRADFSFNEKTTPKDWFIPFWGRDETGTVPILPWEGWGYPVESEKLGINLDSIVFNELETVPYKDCIKAISTLYEYPSTYIYTKIFSRGGKFDTTLYALFPPDTTTARVEQPVDCSQPSIGCFWFNDGRNGQIRLPLDPRVKVRTIYKITQTFVS